MPTITERLEARKQASVCRLCQWLATLDDRTRREWASAIGNPRFTASAVAAEIRVDGGDVSDDSILNHRRKGHK